MNDHASRLDAVAKVTGRAKYARDMFLPGMLHVAFVRCPFGAATLQSVDEEAAKRVPDVLEVVIDRQRGQYHGHNVGYIVAESEPALRRARRAVKDTWKREPVKTGITDSAGDPPPHRREAEEAD